MKIKNILLAFMFGGLALSCTNEFDEINENPNTIEKLTPGYQFGYVQLKYSGGAVDEYYTNLIMVGPLSGVTTCGYRTGQGFGVSDTYGSTKWNVMYQDAVKNGVNLLSVMNAQPDVQIWESRIAQTEILMQLVFQRLTDTYGDIPYTEAGKGFESGIFYPKYDSQEFIYMSMVEKLRLNRDLLLSSNTVSFNEKEDVIYGHLDDQSRKRAWARLANSLLLRIGMRASSADEAWAKEVVEEAANHSVGLIETFDSSSSAIIKHSMDGGPWGIHENGTGSAINGKAGGFAHAYLGDEFLRIAQQRKDPRLFFQGAQIINKNGEYLPYTDQIYFNPFEEANRPGEPWKPVTFVPGRGGADESFSMRGLMEVNGTKVFTEFFIDGSKLGKKQTVNLGTEKEYSFVYDANYVQYRTLCGVNPQTVGSRTAPTFVFGADETYFILAEAAAKGWNVPGNANDLLKQAISLSMDKYPSYYKGDGSPYIYMEKYLKTIGEVSSGSIVSEGELKNKYNQLKEDYIGSLEDATVETIQLERWKSLFLNGYEAFALWNRTELSVTPVGIPYSRNIEVPKYNWNEIATAAPAQPVSVTGGYLSVPFHNGGSTAGVRPRRLDYPNSERMNNTSNLNSAIEAQKSFGNDGSHFMSNRMWISR